MIIYHRVPDGEPHEVERVVLEPKDIEAITKGRPVSEVFGTDRGIYRVVLSIEKIQGGSVEGVWSKL